MIYSHSFTDPEGVVSVVEYNTETGTVNGQTPSPADQEILDAYVSEERETIQRERLDASFQDLRTRTRLNRGDYPLEQRPIIDELNDYRQMLLHLTRLVRGMAAE